MKSEKGFSLVETLVGLIIVAIIGVGVLIGLTMSARATVIGEEQTTAETLARTQMEYVQQQAYDAVNDPPVYSLLASTPATYSIITPMAARLDPKGDGTSNDDGFQKITVTVQRNSRTLYTIVDYKVNR